MKNNLIIGLIVVCCLPLTGCAALVGAAVGGVVGGAAGGLVAAMGIEPPRIHQNCISYRIQRERRMDETLPQVSKRQEFSAKRARQRKRSNNMSFS